MLCRAVVENSGVALNDVLDVVIAKVYMFDSSVVDRRFRKLDRGVIVDSNVHSPIRFLD